MDQDHENEGYSRNRTELKRIINEKLRGQIDWKIRYVRIIASLYKRFLKTKVDELLESDAAFHELIYPCYAYGYYSLLVGSICISRIECKLGKITKDDFIDALNMPDRDAPAYQKYEKLCFDEEFTEWAVKNSELI